MKKKDIFILICIFCVLSVMAYPDDTGFFRLKGSRLAIRADDAAICWVSEDQVIPLGQFTFEMFRNTFHHRALVQALVQDMRRGSDNSIEILYGGSGDSSGQSSLRASIEQSGSVMVFRYRIGYRGEPDGLFKPRVRFIYPSEGPLTRPKSVDASRSGEWRTLRLDYGPVVLEMKSPIAEFEWIGMGARAALPMNLNTAGGFSFEDKVVEFRLRVSEPEAAGLMESVQRKTEEAISDVRAYLTAWQAIVDLRHYETVRHLEQEFEVLLQRVETLSSISPDHLDRAAVWEEAEWIADEAGRIISGIREEVANQRDVVYRSTREFNSRMHFKVGMSLDADPGDRLDKWALFNLNFFRLSTLPTWHGGKTEEQRIRDILEQADQFGAQAILSFDPEVQPECPAEIPFSHTLLPTLRPSFYKPTFISTRLRSAWEETGLRWVEATRDLGNIYAYKIGNEPFWSSRPSPKYGYDLGTAGCSAETLRHQILKQYGDFDTWRGKADQTTLGSRIPWRSEKEIGLSPDSVTGLTFIDFLKKRYASLDQLNAAWFGSCKERGFFSWDEVYPPLPKMTEAGLDISAGGPPTFDMAEDASDDRLLLRPEPESIAAWTDWVAYWPEAVNDHLADIHFRIKQRFPDIRLSVNCITGQFINNYLSAGADTGLNPWITSRGLDDLSIDFYALAYMQPYLRALAGAAEGRPVIIQETAGAEPVMATYMAIYSFAWGADGLLFWRRDHELPPRVCLELSRAQWAMSDPDLQHHSRPVSDGVSMLYSFASLRLADAETGDAGAYLNAWQAESLLLSRLGVLFDVYSDLQCESSIPEGVKVLFCPSALALSDDVFAAVERFVEEGGHLVASPGFAKRDAYGRPRETGRVGRLLENRNVITVPFDCLVELHDEMRGIDPHPRAWDRFTLPNWSGRVADFLERHAPPSVSYSDYVLPAARESADAVYVFVDPWAKNVGVSVKGNFTRVTELFGGNELALDNVAVDGPAILKFERSFPKIGPMKIGTNFKTKLSRLEKDLAILDDFGFESVRMGGLPFDVSSGGFSFPQVEQVASELSRRPLDLLFAMDARPLTSVEQFPEMLNNLQALLTDQNGQLLFQQSFRNFNFNHPELLTRWAAFIHDFSSMASRQNITGREVTLNFNNEMHYAPRSSIAGRKPKPGEIYDAASAKLHLGYSRLRQYFRPDLGLVGDFSDGFHLTDYSAFTIADFQDWLKERYEDIGDLNRVWGSNWAAFDRVEPPRELPFESDALDAAWMDWLAFRFVDFTDIFAWVKETNPSGIPVSHNFIAGRYLLADPFSGVDLWAMGETLDRMGMDYPDVFDLYLLAATDKPVHIIEAAIGYTADYMYHETLLAAVGGARTINFWQRNMDYVAERSNAVSGIRQAWPLVHRLGGTMQTPKVAVFYSHQTAFARLKENASVFASVEVSDSTDDSLQALTEKITGGERSFPVVDYLGNVTSCWMALMESGYAAHPIGSATLAAGKGVRYEAIVVPAATSLSEADFQALENFEGTLIAWGRNWGAYNEWLQPADYLETLFNCRRVDSLQGPVSVAIAGEIVVVDGCDILEPLEGTQVIARTADGRPVAVANGQSVLLGFDLVEPAGFRVYDGLAREVLDLQTFREENSPARIQLVGEILNQFNAGPEVTGLPPGVWYSLLRDGETLRLVLYDYQNWHDLWEKQFDKTICKWDGKNTQPRCVELLPGVDPDIFAPKSKTFDLSINLPGWKPVHAFCDRSKVLQEMDVVSGGDELSIEGMEFLYVIELGKTDEIN
jgi:hypothetical protein